MRFLRRVVRKGLSVRGDFWRDMSQPWEYQRKSIIGRGSANVKALRHLWLLIPERVLIREMT